MTCTRVEVARRVWACACTHDELWLARTLADGKELACTSHRGSPNEAERWPQRDHGRWSMTAHPFVECPCSQCACRVGDGQLTS